MAMEESVSGWIEKLRDGSESAAEKLWSWYFSRLISLARKHLRNAPRQAVDEEDVVQQAFDVCFRALREGRYPKVLHRDDLLYLLLEITQNKSRDQLRHIFAQKRGGRDGFTDKVPFYSDKDSEEVGVVEEALSREPTPEFAGAFADRYRYLLAMLDDDRLKVVVELKVAGYTNTEVAKEIGRSVPSVERYLRLIRKKWGSEFSDD